MLELLAQYDYFLPQHNQKQVNLGSNLTLLKYVLNTM